MVKPVLKTLTRWLRRSPELEVREPVVKAIAVAVVDGLVGSQRPTDRARHHKTMLLDRLTAVAQMAFDLRNGDVSISAMDVSGSCRDPDRTVRSNLAVFPSTSQMRGTEVAPWCRGLRAVVCCAASSLGARERIGVAEGASPKDALVMAVTPTVSIGGLLATVGDASLQARANKKLCVTVALHPPVVHLAQLLRVRCATAGVHGARRWVPPLSDRIARA